ncbi:putative polygalacturonase [Cucumis melo var. makuwa]|uniref:Putative polygalacturonase n=1 Tax=Cucumis melo var. makuwa TaxID=1194695 RepID=A0A5D3BEX0_CUCMM|nr:putative polygalacturonase [Cucumis melo var. makuwa]
MGAFPTPLAAFGLVYAIMFVKGFPEEAIFNVMSMELWEEATQIVLNKFVRVFSYKWRVGWEQGCEEFCSDSTGKFWERVALLKSYSIVGRCKLSQINGVIVAPTSPKEWAGTDKSLWLAFKGISRLSITGSGIGKIDGRGTGWWNQSCRDHPSLEGRTLIAPTATKIISCNDTNLSNLHFINSSQAHVLLMECRRTEIKNLVITAPESSPNTDGIHIHSSHNIIIKNTTIGTGDDCVSTGDYTSHVNISHIKCGPGHGISIGSLGKSGNFVQVEDISVSNIYFKGTTNRARIKTWQQSGVRIANVSIKNLFGTSMSNVAINLNCSRSVACTGILLKSIQLQSVNSGQKVTSSCINVHGFAFGVVQPKPCLQI